MGDKNRGFVRWATLAMLATAGTTTWMVVHKPASEDCCSQRRMAFADTNDDQTFEVQNLSLAGINQEYGEPGKNKSVDESPLNIGGQAFANGIGTHATSEFDINVSGAAKSFSAMVGVDNETGKLGSVMFQIIGDGKVLADSDVMKGGDQPRSLTADLTGVKVLRLSVTDAGDGIDHDHADWCDPKITFNGVAPKAMGAVKAEPAMEIYHANNAVTEINGPKIIGATPNKDFLFKIPVSGRGPWKFTAKNLPNGLTLDPSRGIISGRLTGPGRSYVTISVSGASGSAKRDLTIVGGPHDLALTPPMGWNSWNVWGTSVSQDKIKASADAFIKAGLADYGYAYINIDDAWEAGRSANGEIETNSKFPDMAGLAKAIHADGLKLGIYSSPGPQTCGGYTGSYQHEIQDAKTFAKWGIDYLKYDWCSYGNIDPRPTMEGMQRPYALMSKALNDSDRDIVYSLCQYGMGDVYNWGKWVGGNVWRTTGDITDTWRSMSSIGFSHSPKAAGAGPGGWNDPDMLVVGKLGWGDHPRPTRLTPNEQITHISLWAMLGAPLIIGCDLTQLDSFTKDVLTNSDVIDIDQDKLGKVATLFKKDGDLEVWTRPLSDGTTAVGLFNRGYAKAPINVSWADLGRKGAQNVRLSWLRKDLGKKADGYTAEVPAHGAVLIKVG